MSAQIIIIVSQMFFILQMCKFRPSKSTYGMTSVYYIQGTILYMPHHERFV